MGAGRRKFTKEFKEEASGGSDWGSHWPKWRGRARSTRTCCTAGGGNCRTTERRPFAGNGQRRADESQVAELERKVGRQALEIDFLRRCLQHVEEQRKLQALDSRSLVYPYLEKK